VLASGKRDGRRLKENETVFFPTQATMAMHRTSVLSAVSRHVNPSEPVTFLAQPPTRSPLGALSFGQVKHSAPLQANLYDSTWPSNADVESGTTSHPVALGLALGPTTQWLLGCVCIESCTCNAVVRAQQVHPYMVSICCCPISLRTALTLSLPGP
jgi:hypothetical protein